MYRVIIFLLSCLLLMTSCNNATQQATNPTATPLTKQHFDLKGFFESELYQIDKEAYFIYQKTTQQQRTDSIALSMAACTAKAAPFLALNVSDNKAFTESTFNDNTTQSITLTYKPYDLNQPIQSVDVLVDETSGKVKRVFAKLLRSENNTITEQTLSWKAGKSFSIITSVNNGGSTSVTQEQVIWNE